ncbi:uncharacterized protein MELLADRAFT_113207 [Melampsora larici-populina 98AG31]|uniref:Secreted protein n=1 Tax=Melampsora larici-populina (strain 98AG31 / pathotype 3-4-7) TaxID=747676 RepID=F4RQG7_MELLP|nr:uncharacterized protein MELLADRAFT_107695 [Melampsora larici-populina 98AG31]XP_007417888.1 uncharacterized protein MELLADRAFT_113207 [Melampsora larici-populina 98AG31]EGF98848.1 secreted protein [Melampsora larici-populina 98AG31]EGG05414.1 secreted protein [Melampsora larici-populina 98AG31]
MLNVYPKIFFLLCSLLIHGLKADYYCNVGYTIDTDGDPVCESRYPNTLRYKCHKDSCYSEVSTNKPISITMYSCQRIRSNGSLDPAVTSQDCTTYEYDAFAKNYNCETNDNVSYACAESPTDIEPIKCSNCS